MHAWEEWGEECFSRFNGQWAFALWDRRAERLVLSRDRLGVRPLFFVRRPTGPAVRVRGEGHLRRPLGRPCLRPGRARPDLHLLVAGRAPHRVPRHRAARARALRHPRPRRVPRRAPLLAHHVPRAGPRARGRTSGENAEALRERIVEATRLRFLRSDVPVGAYLSGGIDSSVTAAVIARYTDAPLHTFSLRFADSRVRRGPLPEEDVRVARDRAPGHRGEPVRHRGGLPRGHPARRDADPARGARAAVPALQAGARERLQGGGDGRGGRRGARRIRHLPRGPGAAVLVAGSRHRPKRPGRRSCSIPWMARSPGRSRPSPAASSAATWTRTIRRSRTGRAGTRRR